VVAAVAFAVWVLLFSTWLGLRQVEVEGVHRVSRADVSAAARVAPGTPLARIDLGAVEARVEAIPAVASAAIHRGWPHTIVITVTERQPVAAVHERGTWWLMDKTGTLFGSTSGRDTEEPIVEIDAGPGPETLKQVASVLGLMPADLAVQTKRVTASSVDSITLHLKDGGEVRWGSSTHSVEKATVLRALMQHKAAFYDVSVPSQPATKG